MFFDLRNSSRVNEVLVNISLSLEDICDHFHWSNNTQGTNCNDYFSPIITENGLCHTFNFRKLTEVFKNYS